MHFSFGAAFELGWRTFKAHYGALLGATMLLMLVSSLGFFPLFVLLGGIIELFGQTPGSIALANILYMLVGAFFFNPIMAGALLLFVKHVRGEESPGIGTLFSGFGQPYKQVVSIGGIIIAITLVSQMVATEAWATYSAVAILFGVALYLASLWVGLRLQFASVLCVDPAHRTGVSESLRRSWELTRPPVIWSYMGLVVVTMAIAMTSFALLILPVFFFGLPLMMAVCAAAYVLLADAEQSSDTGMAAPPASAAPPQY